MASKQFLAHVLRKCFTNVHNHLRETVKQNRAVCFHLFGWIFVKNFGRRWKSGWFLLLLVFFPTTRKWKLSIKRKLKLIEVPFYVIFQIHVYCLIFFPDKCGLKPLLIIWKKKFEQCWRCRILQNLCCFWCLDILELRKK